MVYERYTRNPGLATPRPHPVQALYSYVPLLTHLKFNQLINSMVVIIFAAAGTIPGTPEELLEPSLQGRLLINYQNLVIGPGTTTLSLQYYPDPTAPCVWTRYRAELYSGDDIMSAGSKNDLQPVDSWESSAQSLSLQSQLLSNGDNYIRISALDRDSALCTRTDYFTTLLDNGKY